jgi:3-hydroxyisobutyrate dehydrogenase
MAARFGVALPVVERMLGEYAELVSRGYGDEDISATFRLKEELFDAPSKAGSSQKGA